MLQLSLDKSDSRQHKNNENKLNKDHGKESLKLGHIPKV